MKEWFSAMELVGLPGMPKVTRGVRLLAQRHGWSFRKRPGRAGELEYAIASLPPATQAALVLRGQHSARPPAPANDDPRINPRIKSRDGDDQDERRASLWAAFERKPSNLQNKARRRLKLVDAVARLVDSGTRKLKAIAIVAEQSGVQARSLRRWVASVERLDRGLWLPTLAPRWVGRTATVEYSPEAWDFFRTDYLRLEGPRAKACYHRLQRATERSGWTVPSLSTLMRRLAREIDPRVVVMAREGEEAFRRRFPSLRRDHSVFGAMGAVNADGHKVDVFVLFPASCGEPETIARPVVTAWQDIHSGKMLALRTDRSESAESVRLSFADLVEEYGVPGEAWFDNGRAFASKWITGGAANRYRFKIKADDPAGVLTELGVKVHWTQPYRGQSKPIERAFRDFAENLSKHPAFAGAYVGNKPDAKPENYGSRAVPLNEFLSVLREVWLQHNAMPGRRSPVCAGRSFDEVFAESYSAAIVRKATAEQRRLLLLAAEGVTANRDDGSVTLFGNRYWSDDLGLAQLAGRRVVVRFDPQRLDQPAHIYRLDGVYVCAAARTETVGFNDVSQARARIRAERERGKAAKAQVAAERRLETIDLAAALSGTTPPEPPTAKVIRAVIPRVRRVASALTPQPGDSSPEEFQERVSRSLRVLERRNRSALDG